MMTVWKFPLHPRDDIAPDVVIPTSSLEGFLSVQMQDDTPCLWVLLNPEDRKRTWKFRWVMTGEELYPDDLSFQNFYPKFLGTVQVDGFVLHLFVIGFE